eukprot:jgi/Tetstr1/458706/TSEL_045095.t1
MADSPSAPHALLYANHHPPLYRSRSCRRLHHGFPMVIDTDIRRDHDVQLEMTKFASRPPPTAKIAAADLMTDRRNLAQLARFLQRVKEAVHGLIWSAQVESWLVQQFITDGKVGAVYRGLINSLELQELIPMPKVTVSTFFVDFAAFQDRFIKELHGCSTMFARINRFTDRLAISATDSSQPRTAPISLSKSAASIEASALKLREELNTFTILDRHLKAVDAEFSAKRKADNPHGNSPSPK